MPLVLNRKEKEAVRIDDKTTVTVHKIHGSTVTLCFEAPRDVRIVRTELLDEQRQRDWERK